jgi:hypothetical protein
MIQLHRTHLHRNPLLVPRAATRVTPEKSSSEIGSRPSAAGLGTDPVVTHDP